MPSIAGPVSAVRVWSAYPANQSLEAILSKLEAKMWFATRELDGKGFSIRAVEPRDHLPTKILELIQKQQRSFRNPPLNHEKKKVILGAAREAANLLNRVCTSCPDPVQLSNSPSFAIFASVVLAAETYTNVPVLGPAVSKLLPGAYSVSFAKLEDWLIRRLARKIANDPVLASLVELDPTLRGELSRDQQSKERQALNPQLLKIWNRCAEHVRNVYQINTTSGLTLSHLLSENEMPKWLDTVGEMNHLKTEMTPELATLTLALSYMRTMIDAAMIQRLAQYLANGLIKDLHKKSRDRFLIRYQSDIFRIGNLYAADRTMTVRSSALTPADGSGGSKYSLLSQFGQLSHVAARQRDFITRVLFHAKREHGSRMQNDESGRL